MSVGMAEVIAAPSVEACLPADSCLQCEQTCAGVVRDQTFCGIESGYECVELEAEWPRHHWRDWSNRELDQAGIKPEAREKYRRASISTLPYAACEDRVTGHRRAELADKEWGMKGGQCWHCGDTPDPLAAALADPEGHALVKAIYDRKAEA